MYGVAALGQPGAEHVMKVLFKEFECTMSQIGCSNIKNVANFLGKVKSSQLK
jgi:isopentenyl diphosphate isomerase/L-lactate dehydrogenase-like FMN-dependent dehydrogenase